MARGKKNKKNLYWIVLFITLLLLYGSFKVLGSLKEGLYKIRQDRINVVFYNKRPFVLSFGLSDNVNYVISFDNEYEVIVPGGYDRYKIGSLGKLSQIEKTPDLVRAAFSSAMSSPVDYYYIPKSVSVYNDADELDRQFSKKSFLSTIFSGKHNNNASLIDKLYLGWLVVNHRKQDFISLSGFAVPNSYGKLAFSESSFFNKFKGFFFHKSLRVEGAEVKLYYSNYSAASIISRLLEGTGIRVVDLERQSSPAPACLIVFDEETVARYTKTTTYLKHLLNCEVKQGRVQGASVAIFLGESIEKIWE